ncbi:MAG: UDP-glucose--hexose-1-phosphate uridylyltransferase [Eubacteriales bacterium]
MFYKNIATLVQYGLNTGLLPECEKNYATNLIVDLFDENEYDNSYEAETVLMKDIELEPVLARLLDEAVARGIIEDTITHRDLFDTKLMNCLVPRPAQIQKAFGEAYVIAPERATEYFYKLSQDTDYIRRYRVCKDQKWKIDSEYGQIDITINLSKPEKDPKAIAAALKSKSSSYPKCLLCAENEGYAGHMNHPARENHRIIPLTINESKWGFQYSPYVYYNEHCIVFNGQHTPMKIEEATYRKLFDFVKIFPHYFLGSNADLPIVGGSILTHDHFQGGHYAFAMEKAPFEEKFVIDGFEDVEAGIVQWPLSVIRLCCEDEQRLITLATRILDAWRMYTDESAFIYAHTGETPHNTITPIVRKRDGKFEIDLALRNNITTEEHPDGVYHPHKELHHIKKENIGLIEVMGLAVLPSRLKIEMEVLGEYLVTGKDVASNPMIEKHAEWAAMMKVHYDNITMDSVSSIIREEIGKVFVRVLEDAGVFKCTKEGRAAFRRFIETI